MKKHALGIALAALIASPPMIAKADQAAEIADLRQQIEQMMNRLTQLETQQSATNTAVQEVAQTKQKKDDSKFDLKVSGLLQVHAYAPLSGDGSEGNSTFRLRRGELKLSANITDRLSGVAKFDFAKTKIASSKKGDSVLQDLYISYLINKSNSSRIYTDVGQFKLPIGYESLVSSSELPLLDRAMIFTQGDYGDERDTGVQLRGKAGKLEYRLGIFNGLGERQNNTAARDGKALAGRLLWNATDDLILGASLAKGSDDGRIYNAFAVYDQKDFWISGEYAKGSSDSGNTIADGKGYYLTAGYRLHPKLEAVARFDSFDDTIEGKAKEMTLGLNYYIKSQNAKLQLNLVKHNGPLGSGSGYQYDWTELRSGIQVKF